MWFGSALLIASSEAPTKRAARSLNSRYENLVYQERKVREFALGVRIINILRFTYASTTFVDVVGTTHAVSKRLTSRDIFGVDIADFTVESIEFHGVDDLITCVTALTPSDASNRQGNRVLWTKTWKRDRRRWRILNSHVSRS